MTKKNFSSKRDHYTNYRDPRYFRENENEGLSDFHQSPWDVDEQDSELETEEDYPTRVVARMPDLTGADTESSPKHLKRFGTNFRTNVGIATTMGKVSLQKLAIGLAVILIICFVTWSLIPRSDKNRELATHPNETEINGNLDLNQSVAVSPSKSVFDEMSQQLENKKPVPIRENDLFITHNVVPTDPPENQSFSFSAEFIPQNFPVPPGEISPWDHPATSDHNAMLGQTQQISAQQPSTMLPASQTAVYRAPAAYGTPVAVVANNPWNNTPPAPYGVSSYPPENNQFSAQNSGYSTYPNPVDLPTVNPQPITGQNMLPAMSAPYPDLSVPMPASAGNPSSGYAQSSYPPQSSYPVTNTLSDYNAIPAYNDYSTAPVNNSYPAAYSANSNMSVPGEINPAIIAASPVAASPSPQPGAAPQPGLSSQPGLDLNALYYQPAPNQQQYQGNGQPPVNLAMNPYASNTGIPSGNYAVPNAVPMNGPGVVSPGTGYNSTIPGGQQPVGQQQLPAESARSYHDTVTPALYNNNGTNNTSVMPSQFSTPGNSTLPGYSSQPSYTSQQPYASQQAYTPHPAYTSQPAYNTSLR